MKKLLLLPFFILPLLCFSQDAAKAQSQKDDSKLALFSAKTGALIQKTNGPIGKIRSSKIETAIIINLLTDDKIKGIRIEKESAEKYGRDAIAFIDEDEIDGLLKSIQLIKTKVIPTIPDNYTEVSYTSRSGFAFGCFSSDDKWSYYFKVDKYDSDSYEFFQDGDIDNFEMLIKEANEQLKSL